MKPHRENGRDSRRRPKAHVHRAASPEDVSMSSDEDSQRQNPELPALKAVTALDTVSPQDDSEGELADVSFEVLQNIKSDGGSGQRGIGYAKKQKETKRANKNRPLEMSSKKPVPRFREVVQHTKKETRDPRFESLSGKFQPDGFRKAYGFLFDEVLPAENERLKKELKEKRSKGDPDELANEVARVERLIGEDTKRRAKESQEADIRKKQLERIKHGKRPFFLKKSEKKKIELMGKFEKLKETGKLDAYMAKKRKKNAAKDHRFMPYRRPGPDPNDR